MKIQVTILLALCALILGVGAWNERSIKASESPPQWIIDRLDRIEKKVDRLIGDDHGRTAAGPILATPKELPDGP